MPTHLGQSPDDLVYLYSQYRGTKTGTFRRLMRTGKIVDFRIPDGRTLIVTDVSWAATGEGHISVVFGAPREKGAKRPNAAFYELFNKSVSGPGISGHRAMTTGIAVSSPGNLGAWFIDKISSAELQLQGYLVDSK